MPTPGRGFDLARHGGDVEAYLDAVKRDAGTDALDGLAAHLRDEPNAITAVYVSLVTERPTGGPGPVDGAALRALVEHLSHEPWKLPDEPGDREAGLLRAALLAWGLPEEEAGHSAAHEDVWERLRALGSPDESSAARVLSRTNLEGAL